MTISDGLYTFTYSLTPPVYRPHRQHNADNDNDHLSGWETPE